MTTGEKIYNKALSHKGETGGPTWSWWNKRVQNWGTGWAWCCAFVTKVFYECGASKLFYGGGYTASVPIADDWLYKHCKWVKYSEAKKGDIVIFTWHPSGSSNTRSGTRDHIGIFEKRVNDSTFKTIEGNTGNNPAHVLVKSRNRAYIYAIYRPNYDTKAPTDGKKYSGTFPTLPARGYFKKGDKGVNVKRLQRLINWIIDAKLVVDGVIGNKTKKAVKKAQKRLGVKTDGLWGKNSQAAAKSYRKK